ncbi:rhodanese-like domain-containing protein [Hyphobacterium sp. HN65]|uniref:Rhodanese-like domain-containing protein n=1 Tax=Hyphobacterium lacteum TaxID=3116575 RepID=A0ABU7LQF8_9PROT|nr:rhodanese-like domain-containing protein [Hyphobacterium sp. HN65]MEE2526150.1 rhodanese-like domain-containing protein [Hyphobacterium sp. HN65]
MSFQEISPADTAESLRNGNAVLIDVREPHEYGAERIHGALLYPMSTFDPRALPIDSSRDVILHCGSAKRSGMALMRCAEAGVPINKHLAGGIMLWKREGLPTIKVDPATGRVFDPQQG